jgi:hypothetical protein
MPPHIKLLIGVFISSAVLHLLFFMLKNRCNQIDNKSSFINFILEAGSPYVLNYGFIYYGLPIILTFVGFGPLGILPCSIATWIQSMYGTSSIFSLLQSIVARGGIKNSFGLSVTLGSLLKSAFNWGSSRNQIAECLNYYETLSFYLTVFDLSFIIGYWLFRYRLFARWLQINDA